MLPNEGSLVEGVPECKELCQVGIVTRTWVTDNNSYVNVFWAADGHTVTYSLRFLMNRFRIITP